MNRLRYRKAMNSHTNHKVLPERVMVFFLWQERNSIFLKRHPQIFWFCSRLNCQSDSSHSISMRQGLQSQIYLNPLLGQNWHIPRSYFALIQSQFPLISTVALAFCHLQSFLPKSTPIIPTTEREFFMIMEFSSADAKTTEKGIRNGCKINRTTKE